MQIIYYSYWSTYAAYLAAALHTGSYRGKSPSKGQIDRQWNLCKRYSQQFGNLLYIGLDDRHREVYALGCKRQGDMAKFALKGFVRIFTETEAVHLVKAGPLEGPIPFLIEGFYRFSKRKRILRLAFHFWMKRTYKKCKELVFNTRQDLDGE
ncbi:MAG: DUF3189 family protein [Caldicoprobacterales bacterium]